MDGFMLLLAGTVFLRGSGAGMITGILLLTMPAQSRLGWRSYAGALRAMYGAWGVKVYGVITGLGLILTIVALVWAILRGESPTVVGLLAASLAATVGGFVGTAGAYPAMKKLFAAPDEDQRLVLTLLSRFGKWGIVSGCCHVAAFALITAAMSTA
ncbi:MULTISPECIES: hypothetical protein [unclassified Mycobacterium]|uniref:hypothetical protein n=1 Tax=unclassified Mycobacterium TaxID=2642494 RepID=UPI0007403D92|nr:MULTISPECIES: hypothetical protein [unclassified Mycobacterium]KUH81391.1 hypothetical protein AU185_16010 [Mycobacterium sp. GA-0227b]KUH83521.1 hypothetical protein AU186_15700 [Mycobacterium sp. GA-1999]